MSLMFTSWMTRFSDVPQSGDAGFIAVDALVGLTILTVSIGLTLQTVDTARRLARQADEIQAAQALASQLRLQPVANASELSGADVHFQWRVAVTPDRPDAAAPSLCRRQIELVAAQSKKVFRFAATELCRGQGVGQGLGQAS